MEKAANLSPKAVSVMGRLGKKATVAWYQALASLELRKQSKQIVTIDDHEVAKELEEAGLLIPYVHKRVKRCRASM
jgi:hypothetical protein